MTDDAVSVIIPTYNRAHLVARAVDSVLAAVEPRDEVIVVDDGLTDGTRNVLAAYEDRIRYILTDSRGAGAARNTGVKASSRPLVAFLDSDDEWTPDKLYLQRAALGACKDAVLCFTDFGVRRRSGTEVHKGLARWQRYNKAGTSVSLDWAEELERALHFSELAPLPDGQSDFNVFIGDMYPVQMRVHQISTITVLIDRRKADGILWFPEDLPSGQDWECFSRIAGIGSAIYLDCETAWLYEHNAPRLSTDFIGMYVAETRVRVLNRVWGQDARFLSRHGSEYEARLRYCHLERVRCLLRMGAVRDAKEALRQMTNAPLVYRLLALLPGWAVRRLLSVREIGRDWLRQHRKAQCREEIVR